jgi:hypothetical protein
MSDDRQETLRAPAERERGRYSSKVTTFGKADLLPLAPQRGVVFDDGAEPDHR